MFGIKARFVMVFLVAFTCVMSVVGAPKIARGSEGGFTAAATVLKQSGTVGRWKFAEPPGFPPVQCTYYPNGFNPGYPPQNYVTVQPPDIYSKDGLSTQPVYVNFWLNQRWPDGSLHRKTLTTWNGQAGQYTPAAISLQNFFPYDRGSTFVVTVEIIWYFANVEAGRVELLYIQYQSNISGSPALPVTNACKPLHAATAVLGKSEGTVGTSVPFTIEYFPSDPQVGVYFDGTKIKTVATDEWGGVNGSFVVPAAPMGKHTVKFYRFGRSASATFTVKPRIKVIPSSGLQRGQTVNVSLRGYAKYETVNIRWKKGTSWVQVGQVKTSSTGSANINVTVPKWVPDGSTSVRGDGSYGHAQTNAVTVSGGPMSASTAKPSPTPTQTASPTSTAVPATPTPEPVATEAPTEQPATPEAVPSVTATQPPTETETPAAEPTEEPQATETPLVEPTTVPSETPEPTAMEG